MTEARGGPPAVLAFDRQAEEYDRWFELNARIYHAEIDALRRFVPPGASGVEVGVGTGRFAAPLGIATGVEPARLMAERARARGVRVVRALAERMPFRDAAFDFVLFVTVICFVADAAIVLEEARRVLRSGGRLVIGFIDRESALGRRYESGRSTSPFYRFARFRSAAELKALVRALGFVRVRFAETLHGLPGAEPEAYRVRDGHGSGGFVVLAAEKGE